MLRSSPALRLRRGLARRADTVLGALRLVEPRSRPEGAFRWADPIPTPAPAPAPAPVPEPSPEPTGLAFEAVQEVLDEMVRPALQSDGGDIKLIDVKGGDVHVELVGACHSCPSAVLTMKMGVESLLAEELEGFERLIQVDGPMPGMA